jgi:hypothetical protein
VYRYWCGTVTVHTYLSCQWDEGVLPSLCEILPGRGATGVGPGRDIAQVTVAYYKMIISWHNPFHEGEIWCGDFVQPLGLSDSCGGQTDLLLITSVAQAFGEHFRSPSRFHLPCLEPRGCTLLIWLDGWGLMGQSHEIFCFRFFSWIIFPQAPVTAIIGHSGARGKLIHGKTWSRTSHDTVPLSFTL